MRDDKVDASLNATLDTGFVMFKILFTISCLDQLRQALVNTKLDVAHQALQYLQPQLAFMPKAL